MQISGLRYGAGMMKLVEFPVADYKVGSANKEELQSMLDKYNKLVIKPLFSGGVGKKGKAGLVKIADNVIDALEAKEQLYFAKHEHKGKVVKANGVTFEEFVESELEIYFSISNSTFERKPIFNIAIEGGIGIEELDDSKRITRWIDPLIGIKSFDITNALNELKCPEHFISPLVQNLPKLWSLYSSYGVSSLELNPIRLKKQGNGYLPIACDIKASFDQDNPDWKRVGLPPSVFESETTKFEADINKLRTYQGQSDVVELNPNGSIIPFMFGGGANTAATEILSDRAIFASDFGGNPPYQKMYEISRIVLEHWYEKANVFLIIGGKANNTDIYVTFKGIFDALRDHIAENSKKPVYTIIGRGGPQLIKGFFYAKDILDTMKLPYKMFGHDTSMMKVLEYAKKIDLWWAAEGRRTFEEKYLKN